MEQYSDVLYRGHETNHMIELKSLRLSRDRQMARFSIHKKGLTDLFYKLRVESDRISCTPLQVNNEYL